MSPLISFYCILLESSLCIYGRAKWNLTSLASIPRIGQAIFLFYFTLEQLNIILSKFQRNSEVRKAQE